MKQLKFYSLDMPNLITSPFFSSCSSGMNGVIESPVSSSRMTSTNTTSDNSSMSHLLMPSVPASSDVSFCCMSLMLSSLIPNFVEVISWNRLEAYILFIHFGGGGGVFEIPEPHFYHPHTKYGAR